MNTRACTTYFSKVLVHQNRWKTKPSTKKSNLKVVKKPIKQNAKNHFSTSLVKSRHTVKIILDPIKLKDFWTSSEKNIFTSISAIAYIYESCKLGKIIHLKHAHWQMNKSSFDIHNINMFLYI